MERYLQSIQTFLSANKDAFAALESLGTFFAFTAGGAWVVKEFLRRRLHFPRASTHHAVDARKIMDGKWHIHVKITIANLGEVLLRLKTGHVWIQLIDPCSESILGRLREGMHPVNSDSTEVLWDRADDVRDFKFSKPHEIEPGESDEFDADFFADEPIRRILAYSYFENISKRRRLRPWKKKDIGWYKSTFYDLPSNESVSCPSPAPFKPSQLLATLRSMLRGR